MYYYVKKDGWSCGHAEYTLFKDVIKNAVGINTFYGTMIEGFSNTCKGYNKYKGKYVGYFNKSNIVFKEKDLQTAKDLVLLDLL